MSRFFISQANIYPDGIAVSGEDAAHIGRVLRHKQGDMLTLCDGNGTDYLVEIDRITTDTVFTHIVKSGTNNTEPPIDITLFQGVPKSDKMEFIIQKSIELGVKRIVPVLTERTVVRFDSSKDTDSKVKRWQKISLEAAKQSNRGMIPAVAKPISFAAALKLAGEAELSIIPYEKEERETLKKHISDRRIGSASVMIGPEGGFSEKEVQEAINAGIVPVTLGPRILRTETAGIAVLAMLMYELGDINLCMKSE
jgi:16S rRNA (uracil1498-N3)-methyltransferase